MRRDIPVGFASRWSAVSLHQAHETVESRQRGVTSAFTRVEMSNDKHTRLFHAVIVVGSTIVVPAIAVGVVAVTVLSAPGCGGDKHYTGISVGVDLGQYTGITTDIGGITTDIGFYNDIGVPDSAEPVDADGAD